MTFVISWSGFARVELPSTRFSLFANYFGTRHRHSRIMTVVLTDLGCSFDSAGGSGIPENFLNLLQALCWLTHDRVLVYGELSILRETSGGRLILPSLCDFIMGEVIVGILEGRTDVCVEPGNVGHLCDLDSTDDVTCLFGPTEHAHSRQTHEACVSIRHVLFIFRS